MSRYKWLNHGGGRLYEVGILDDGTLYNPRGYKPELVRRAVLAADERKHARRSAAAKKASETRLRRQERAVYAIARRVLGGRSVGPRERCAICRRALDDPPSIERGIGSECWQHILVAIEELKAKLDRTGA